MVNPWIWHIMNDKMPYIYPVSGMVLLIVGAWILFLVAFEVGLYCFGKHIIGFENEHFMEYYLSVFTVTNFLFIGMSVWLLPKALHKWDGISKLKAQKGE